MTARAAARSDPKIKSQPASSAWVQPFLLFALFFAGLMLLHAPLLRLPYFWDEAGYYIHAVKCPSSTGDGVAGAGLARLWILHVSHAHGYAGGVSILAAGIVSTFADRRQSSRGVGDNRVSGALSGVLHAEFYGAG